MSIQSIFVNFILKKYIKQKKSSVEESSYLDARKMMNQKGYEEKTDSILSEWLTKKIFGSKDFDILIDEIFLGKIRTLKFSKEEHSQKKCILYFHGGGYVAGSPETHKNFLADLCEKSKINIYAIDYSLAPENPYPAALNDAISSYEELIKIGYDHNNIIFGGDSAGGNLTLVSTLRLQQLGINIPKKLFLLSPWTDLTGEGESIKTNSKKDPYLSYNDWLSTSKSMKKNVEEWYAPNQDYQNPLISPIFANYVSFPEILIQVSNIEILLSDSVEVAKKIKSGNNQVTLSIYKNLPHVWQIFGFLPEAKQATEEIAKFINN
tara:strand:+ start:2395 stop:3357 length:963 start_codon:yes stop_codon:yes gene_type:complete